MLRLRNNNKKAELSMGERWSQEDFEDAQSEKPKFQNQEKRRFLLYCTSKIEEIKHQLQADGRSNEDVDIIKDILKDILLGKAKEQTIDKIRFSDYFLKVGSTKAASTESSFKYTLSCINKYDSAFELKTFEDINYGWLSDFEAWMKKRELSQNTRKIHFGNIRIAMREAYKRELTENDPFRTFSFRPKKTIKRSVDVDILRNLFNYKV